VADSSVAIVLGGSCPGAVALERTQGKAALTDVKQSAWFAIVYCFFAVGEICANIFFMIFAGRN